MTISLSYKAYQSQDDCPICLESLDTSKPVVAHESLGGKMLHPIHRKCVKQVLMYAKAVCPICRASVNTSSVLSWSERCGVFCNNGWSQTIFCVFCIGVCVRVLGTRGLIDSPDRTSEITRFIALLPWRAMAADSVFPLLT